MWSFPSYSYIMFHTMQLAFYCMVGYNNYNTVIFQQNFRCSTIYDLTYGYKIKSIF